MTLRRNSVGALMLGAIVMVLTIAAVGGRAEQNKSGDSAKPKAGKAAGTKRDQLREFMRAKLSASNKILEGLCTEDFELVAQGAKTLETLSAAEEWQVSNDPLYRQQSNQFQRAARQLAEAADEKKLDSASLAWVQATMNCIECHKWVKATLITGN